MRRRVVPTVVLLAAACGSSKPSEPPKTAVKEVAPASAPDPKPADDPPAETTASGSKLPTACVSKGDVCTLPKDFVTRLCQATFPNVAFALLAKGTPWTRGYLTRKTQAWNAEGGASVQDWLEFDEEVVILAARIPPKGGMQVSGMGGYQALRWDGSCVTLATEEVTTRRPPSPKHPRIDWRWIDDGMKEALRKDGTVDAAYLSQRKECKGVAVGDVSKKCVEADGKLGNAIVDFIENTGGLPQPEKLP